MEHTFMTIHNLTPDCNILFASDSITDILGWRPEEVHGRSVFSYFHPDEVPFARSIHSRGILLDKAASLHYARLVTRDASIVGTRRARGEQSRVLKFEGSFLRPPETPVTTCWSTSRPSSRCRPWNVSPERHSS
ncbi:hypothetical protein FJTKL_07128 [Diaporthe vaccinii]|uniref:PAS domain-containing protein n=1 Tax=Diaporthe vaccinii TaxID=105482 RepID=A0ABR4EV76_9PEZI